MGFHFSTRIFHFRRKHPFKNLLLKSPAIFSSFSTFSAENPFYIITFPHTFQECSKKKAREPGRQAHARMIVSGFKPTVFASNCLLQMYIKCSRLDYAVKVFDRMSERDCVSWTTMISGYSVNGKMGLAQSLFDLMPERNVISWTCLMTGYLQNGNGLKSVEVFVMMGRDAVAYDETSTFSVVLRACANLKDIVIGQQVHGVVVKLGFECEVVIGTTMLDMYAKCNMLDESIRFFDVMPVRTLVSWSAMIAGCVQNNDLEGGLQLFKKMQREGVGVNQFVYTSVFKSCAGLSYSRLGFQLHGHALKSDFGADTAMGTAILDMYAKCDNLIDARKVFNLLPNHDLHSYTALIVGYARGDCGFEGMQLFLMLLKSELGFNEISLSAAFSSCAVSKGLLVGTQIHGLAIKTPFHDNISVANAILDMYGKCGALPEAFHILDEMKSRDVVTWSTMVSAYAGHGYVNEALQVFEKMQREGVGVSQSVYSIVVNSCSKVANVGLGKQIHAQIIKHKLQSDVSIINALVDMYSKCGSMQDSVLMFQKSPNRDVVTWNTMVCAYAHHGYGNKALQVFEKMLLEKVMPNHLTFTGVLLACAHNGLVDGALHYLYAMQSEYGVLPDLQHYSCVVDALGRSGRIIDALKLIENMTFKADCVIWKSLLSNCKMHGNVEVAEIAARSLVQLDPQDSTAYVLLSQIYADAGMWDEASNMRRMMMSSGLKKKPAPPLQTDRFIFQRIRGGFHEIRNSISNIVVVARILNATLVIPEIQSTTSSKGIRVQEFAYLFSEDQFMTALVRDIRFVKTLPEDLKGAQRKKEIPSFKVPSSASPYFYLHHVLPVLNKHSVVELVVPDGGCLQALLPPHLEEYQRLRCQVTFHALKFRDEVQELATKILYRLRSSGRPFIAYDPGMTRDALAYHGCAKLFQDALLNSFNINDLG